MSNLFVWVTPLPNFWFMDCWKLLPSSSLIPDYLLFDLPNLNIKQLSYIIKCWWRKLNRIRKIFLSNISQAYMERESVVIICISWKISTPRSFSGYGTVQCMHFSCDGNQLHYLPVCLQIIWNSWEHLVFLNGLVWTVGPIYEYYATTLMRMYFGLRECRTVIYWIIF